MRFQGKVVIITGASSGIGAAAALLFSKEGASLVLVGRNQEKLAAVETMCKKLGSPPLVLRADVSNDDQAKTVVKTTIDKYGKLDVLVNNAGIVRFGVLVDGTIMNTFDEVMNTNLRATVLITSLAAPHLIKTKGNIINISSVSGSMVKLGKCHAYSVSKAASNHFTKGAALELATHGVRVNSISPGPVRTDILENASAESSWDVVKELTALKRCSEPEEVADLIAYLASDAARSVTGSDYVIDNGVLF